MVGVKIVGTGAFIRSRRDARRRPYFRGAEVSVDDHVARRLVASGVAVYSDTPDRVERPVGVTDESTDQQIADATMSELLAFVGDNTERATRVLAVEQAKAKPRRTLVDALEKIVGGDA